MDGTARVVVGARSALLSLPFANLKMIVVDEEREPSYHGKEMGSAYHARDMAVLRGAMLAIPVVLVSATPSLETQAISKAADMNGCICPRGTAAR